MRTRIHANATSTWARKHAKQVSTEALEHKKLPNTETRRARGLAYSSNLMWQSRINGNFPKFLKNISETICRIRNYIVLEHCLWKICFSLKKDFSHSFFPRKLFLKILNHILPGKRILLQQPTYTLKINFVVVFQQRFLRNSELFKYFYGCLYPSNLSFDCKKLEKINTGSDWTKPPVMSNKVIHCLNSKSDIIRASSLSHYWKITW